MAGSRPKIPAVDLDARHAVAIERAREIEVAVGAAREALGDPRTDALAQRQALRLIERVAKAIPAEQVVLNDVRREALAIIKAVRRGVGTAAGMPPVRLLALATRVHAYLVKTFPLASKLSVEQVAAALRHGAEKGAGAQATATLVIIARAVGWRVEDSTLTSALAPSRRKPLRKKLLR